MSDAISRKSNRFRWKREEKEEKGQTCQFPFKSFLAFSCYSKSEKRNEICLLLLLLLLFVSYSAAIRNIFRLLMETIDFIPLWISLKNFFHLVWSVENTCIRVWRPVKILSGNSHRDFISTKFCRLGTFYSWLLKENTVCVLEVDVGAHEAEQPTNKGTTRLGFSAKKVIDVSIIILPGHTRLKCQALQ